MALLRFFRGPSNGRELNKLNEFIITEVLQAQEDGSSLVLLGKFKFLKEGENAIVKLKSKPITKDELLHRVKDIGLKLTSESGAEYAYYSGQLWPDLGAFFAGRSLCGYDVEVISPASQRQIDRCRPVKMVIVTETGPTYAAVTAPAEAAGASDGALGWVYKVLNKDKEEERVLIDDDQMLLNVDTKWSSHPDCRSVPRADWKNHPSVQNLYVLAFAKEHGITSLRALRGRHLPLLRHMYRVGVKTIAEVYGVAEEELRVFVHYRPQFFHFHVHFTRLSNEWGVSTEHAVLLSTIIYNLEVDSDYYVKATMQYRIRTNDPLYEKIKEFSSHNLSEQAQLEFEAQKVVGPRKRSISQVAGVAQEPS